jgi:hypothetical protein
MRDGAGRDKNFQKFLSIFLLKRLARAGDAARAMIAAGDHCQDLISSS